MEEKESVPFSCQIPEDLGQWLEEEASRLMTSKSAVARQIFDRARREALVLADRENQQGRPGGK